MKKIMLVVGIVAVTAVSCTKSYNCVCTTVYSGVMQGTPNLIQTTVIDDTNANATVQCNDKAGSVAGGSTTTCILQ